MGAAGEWAGSEGVRSSPGRHQGSGPFLPAARHHSCSGCLGHALPHLGAPAAVFAVPEHAPAARRGRGLGKCERSNDPTGWAAAGGQAAAPKARQPSRCARVVQGRGPGCGPPARWHRADGCGCRPHRGWGCCPPVVTAAHLKLDRLSSTAAGRRLLLLPARPAVTGLDPQEQSSELASGASRWGSQAGGWAAPAAPRPSNPPAASPARPARRPAASCRLASAMATDAALLAPGRPAQTLHGLLMPLTRHGARF